LGLRRGDIVVLAPPGEFGKPRPALIIQSDHSIADATVTFLPFTSDLGRYPATRVRVDPSESNGLHVDCEVMVNLIQTVSTAKVSRVIGRVDRATMQAIEIALMVHLGLV
jgi:mRNA interferase MazF